MKKNKIVWNVLYKRICYIIMTQFKTICQIFSIRKNKEICKYDSIVSYLLFQKKNLHLTQLRKEIES